MENIEDDNLLDILDTNTIIKEKPLEFLLEFQQLKNQSNVKDYIDKIKTELDKRNVKYEMKLLPDDEEIEINKMIGGNDLTFPYNYFDSFFNILKKIINNDKLKLKTKNDNIISKLFDKNYKENIEETKLEISPEIQGQSIDETEEFILPELDVGLVRIYLIIYDTSNIIVSNKKVCGIYELNNWLYKK